MTELDDHRHGSWNQPGKGAPPPPPEAELPRHPLHHHFLSFLNKLLDAFITRVSSSPHDAAAVERQTFWAWPPSQGAVSGAFDTEGPVHLGSLGPGPDAGGGRAGNWGGLRAGWGRAHSSGRWV